MTKHEIMEEINRETLYIEESYREKKKAIKQIRNWLNEHPDLYDDVSAITLGTVHIDSAKALLGGLGLCNARQHEDIFGEWTAYDVRGSDFMVIVNEPDD